MLESLLAKWSAGLTASQEATGSIPNTSTILRVDKIWNGVYPTFEDIWIGLWLEIADLIKKFGVIRLNGAEY